MQPLVLDATEVATWMGKLWWPALRIGGFVLSAPAVSEVTVPPMVKIVFTLALAFLLAPFAPVPVSLSIFSGAGALAAVQEMLVGVAIGLVMQFAFEALTLAGETISATMGIGFATLIDPRYGANTMVIGQFFLILGMLVYLAIDGHLLLIGAFAHSFQTLPIGSSIVDRDFLLSVVGSGARIFETGTLVALPTVIALVIVNLALGVVTRAAPQLNLFGIGFTITVLAGFGVLLAGFDGIMQGVHGLIDSALQAVVALIDRPLPGAR